jgi:hypothetical protein
MRNLLIVCNPGRVDAVVAAVELQQNLASTFGIYTISDVDHPRCNPLDNCRAS